MNAVWVAAGAGNSFTTLEGLGFQWKIDQPADLATFESFRDASISTSEERIRLELSGVQSDMVVMKGLKPGEVVVGAKPRTKFYQVRPRDQLFGFGSNEFGQACLALNVESSRRLARAVACPGKVDRFWALHQLSVLRTQQAEDQFVGLLKRDPLSTRGSPEIARHPEDFALAPGVAPHAVRGLQSQVHCLGSDGKLYLWDSRVSLGFKEELGGGAGFCDLRVGR